MTEGGSEESPKFLSYEKQKAHEIIVEKKEVTFGDSAFLRGSDKKAHAEIIAEMKARPELTKLMLTYPMVPWIEIITILVFQEVVLLEKILKCLEENHVKST